MARYAACYHPVPLGVPIRRTLAISSLILVVCLGSGGCLWLPEFPFPDKIDPDTPGDTDDLIAFCTPRPRRREPVLVGGQSDYREVRCRIRGAHTVEWRVLGVEDSDLEDLDLVVATGVERVVLHRSSLPWSPQPYEVELALRVERENGGGADESWPLLVVPDGDELVVVPVDEEAGAEVAP